MNRTTLALLALGVTLEPALCEATGPDAAQAAAIAKIQKLGGTISIAEKMPGKPVIAVDLFSTGTTDSGLESLEPLRSLESFLLAAEAETTHFKANDRPEKIRSDPNSSVRPRGACTPRKRP